MKPLVKAKDVIDARRWFVRNFVHNNTYFFVHENIASQFTAAEDLFDMLVGDFTADALRRMAKAIRREEREDLADLDWVEDLGTARHGGP